MARVANASVATGGTLNQDVLTGGAEYLQLTGIVGTVANAAGALGDVTVQVFAYMDDAPGAGPTLLGTLSPLVLPTLEAVTAVLSASRAWIWQRYRVAGIRAVQIQVKNNNIAAKPVEVDFDLG